MNNPWFLLSILGGFASFAMWADKNTRWGKAIGATNISLIIGMILVNLNVVPSWSDVHGAVFSYAVPIGISLLLFQANIRKSLKLGPKLLIAFVIGTVATVVGAIVAAFVFNIGPETWKVYGMYAGTYTGGSANLAAIGTALEIDPSIFVAINAADIVVFFFWMMFLSQAGKWIMLKNLYPERPLFDNNLDEKSGKKESLFGFDAAVALGIAIVASAIGVWLGPITNIPAILITTTIMILLANYTPIHNIKIANELGLWLFMIFFVTIGAMAVFKDVIQSGLTAFYGAATIIIVHGTTALILGKFFRIPLEYIIISSSANVGGASTSGPHAAAYGWTDLVAPAVLMGVLGAAVGTYVGFGVSYLLQAIL